MKFSAILLTAIIPFAAPNLAWAATYDGIWSVSIITKDGSCSNYRWDITIANGQATEIEGKAGLSSGDISNGGQVAITIVRDSDTLNATGSAAGASASGTWTSPTLECSGVWDAARSE